MNKVLREGFTTGTAVAGAAIAALQALLNNTTPAAVNVPLPPFDEKGRPKHRLTIPIANVLLQRKKNSQVASPVAIATVVKDGGDDPDATHGIALEVSASLAPFTFDEKAVLNSSEFAEKKIHLQKNKQRKNSAQTNTPSNRHGHFTLNARETTITVTTGLGIGIVTLPGLTVSIGEPAFNPEPRKQLCAAILEVIPSLPSNIYLHIEAPEGEERAKKTLNPRLGILGGISILGTHGTVRPYSHEAFTATINQSLDIAVALGLDTVLFSTGRRSEKLLFSHYQENLPQAGIQIADFAAHAVRECALRNIKGIIWGCFPGKLVKLAQGLEWTHASQGAPDMNLISSLWCDVGGCVSLVPEIKTMPTATGAFALMAERDKALYRKVINKLGNLALGVLVKWLNKSSVQITLHVFSMEGEQLLCLTSA